MVFFEGIVPNPNFRLPCLQCRNKSYGMSLLSFRLIRMRWTPVEITLILGFSKSFSSNRARNETSQTTCTWRGQLGFPAFPSPRKSDSYLSSLVDITKMKIICLQTSLLLALTATSDELWKWQVKSKVETSQHVSTLQWLPSAIRYTYSQA